MKMLYFFGTSLNGLEFVVYILFPTAIILIILTYLFFNLKFLKLTYDIEIKILDSIDSEYCKKIDKEEKTLSEKIDKEEKLLNKLKEEEEKLFENLNNK